MNLLKRFFAALSSPRLSAALAPASAILHSRPPSAEDRDQVDVWHVEIAGGRVSFSRWANGKCLESYGAVDKARAAVYAAAIVQGFEPPRSLLHAD